MKRSFLRVETIRKDTDAHFRYYMFKRLNTGGELLSEQEVRNCTIRLLDEKFNAFLLELSGVDDFKICIDSLTEERKRKMDDVELVLKFFAFKNNFAEFRHDIGPFLTDYMERVSDLTASGHIEFDYELERREFLSVFGLLAKTLGKDTCLRWLGDERFGGQFLMQHYEALTLGVAKVIDKLPPVSSHANELRGKLISIKSADEFYQMTTGGGQNSQGPYRRKIDFVAKGLAD